MMESDKPIRMLRDRFFGFNLVEKAEGRLRREDFGVSAQSNASTVSAQPNRAATELVEVQSNEGRRQKALFRRGLRPLLLYKPLNESSVGA
jgi:hypothetical protein